MEYPPLPSDLQARVDEMIARRKTLLSSDQRSEEAGDLLTEAEKIVREWRESCDRQRAESPAGAACPSSMSAAREGKPLPVKPGNEEVAQSSEAQYAIRMRSAKTPEERKKICDDFVAAAKAGKIEPAKTAQSARPSESEFAAQMRSAKSPQKRKQIVSEFENAVKTGVIKPSFAMP